MSTAIQSISSPKVTVFFGVGFSEEFSKLKKQYDNVIREFRSTETIGRPLKEALQSLKEVFQECSEEGWDGYDALPISEEAYLETRRLLESLPLTSFIPMPEIIPEPTGDIGLEWSKGPDMVFVISVRGKNEIVYAGLFGRNKTHGIEYFSESLPPVIIENLKRLYLSGNK
ncbi:hypothetical protein MNBD_NITROSPIRAE03-84 [hydrothermal vent metagenome]|uniref:Uncharacterized protein n=1 Tax=hydrothermal vent metagenome TaxID=652676 RepID=A0A3B1D3T2_9ZZZZ